VPDYYSVPDYHVAPDTIDRRNLNFTMPLPIQPRRLAEPVAGLRPHRPGIRPHSCVFTSRDQKYSTDAGSRPADCTPKGRVAWRLSVKRI
jgi:hypothetical protein